MSLLDEPQRYEVALRTRQPPIQEKFVGLDEVLGSRPAAASAPVELPVGLMQRLAAVEREVRMLNDIPPAPLPTDVPAEIVERLSALEQRLAEPVGLDADVPEFASRFAPRPPEPIPDPPPAAPTVAQHIANAAVLSRLDALERQVVEMQRAAEQPLEPAPVAPAAPAAATGEGPPLRVVEVAHLARNGQVAAMALMARLGTATGTDWETAALTVIRRHDEATAAAVEAYAIEIETRGA